MVKTRKHPDRMMYECRLCISQEPKKEMKNVEDNDNKDATIKEETSGGGNLNIVEKTDKNEETKLETKHPQSDAEGSSNNLDPCSSKEQNTCNSNDVKEKTKSPKSKTSKKKSTIKIESIFKSNYATEFREHLTNFHKNDFSSKAEVNINIFRKYMKIQKEFFNSQKLCLRNFCYFSTRLNC